MAEDEGERMLSVPQVARRAQVDPVTVRRWLKAGKLKAWQPGEGGRWKVKESELQRFLSGAPGGERA